jgi:hypothetical protein
MQAARSTVLALACVAFSGLACSSSLDEFRCTAAAQCTQDGEEGVCSSGYCAFDDAQCPSGLRYGNASGEQSDRCVGDETGGPDAAPGRPPVASIAAINLDCGNTVIQPDGSGSRAFDGALVTRFEWTLLSPNGVELGALAGLLNQAVPVGAILLGGTMQSPLVNVTPYMDQKALHAVASDKAGRVSQIASNLLTGSYAIFGSLAGNPGASGNNEDVVVEVLNGSGAGSTFLVEQAIAPGPSMQLFSFEFDILFSSTADVGLRLPRGSNVWIDNFAVVRRENGGEIFGEPTQNRSFEAGLDPWEADTVDLLLTSEDLPAELLRPGAYRVELVVVDNRGARSEPAVELVSHEPCLSTPPS